jgi:hypothetical protein
MLREVETMITTVQFKTLDDLYQYYNKALFGGALAECIVNMSRHNSSYGFFAAERWKSDGEGEEKIAHEISLNPDYLDRPFEQWHSTLVHEMVHLWQYDFGHPSRTGYHNKEWAWKMREVGLVPSDTARPGGSETGQKVSHYINSEGPFIRAFQQLAEEDLKALRLKYLPAFSIKKPERRKPKKTETGGIGTGEADGGEDGPEGKIETYNSKSKYSCPCGNNVWGKPGLNIVCGDCGGAFEMVLSLTASGNGGTA